jgi:extradiol dioxygenase family protein
MEKWKPQRSPPRSRNHLHYAAPHPRFEGEVGEQAAVLFLDPAGNALEFKAFAAIRIFAK